MLCYVMLCYMFCRARYAKGSHTTKALLHPNIDMYTSVTTYSLLIARLLVLFVLLSLWLEWRLDVGCFAVSGGGYQNNKYNHNISYVYTRLHC